MSTRERATLDRRSELNCRLVLMFLAMAAVAGGIGYWAYTIQILRHDELSAKARDRYTVTTTRVGERGRIYDCYGELLAGNLATQHIWAEPGRMLRRGTDGGYESIREEMIEGLSYMLGQDPGDLTRRLEGARRISIAKHLSNEAARDIQAMYRMNRWAGLEFEEGSRRSYPKGPMLANVLGFLDYAGNGVYGLERVFNDAFLPSTDSAKLERTRTGLPLLDSIPDRANLDGMSAYLTIDEAVQAIVEDELARLVREFEPKFGYVAMANPRTGAIMAMAQAPTFDPNGGGSPQLSRNRILSEPYDPGSTMKCVSVAAALDFGVVDLDTVVPCHNGYWPDYRLNDTHAYAELTVAEVIQHSSNIGTAEIAITLGKPRLYQAFRRFGFGENTGLLDSLEKPGRLKAPHAWDSYSITRFPMGQGITVTPLQMLQAYCGLANNGVIMQLRLVDRTNDPRTGVTTHFPPLEKQRAIRPAAAHQMVEAMKLVVSDGTAKRAQVPGFAVAGKTGTAQKWVDGAYSHREYYVSFVGFVPAHDPAFVLLVAADTPTKRSRYGGTVCGPTFSRIAQRSLQYLNVIPTIADFEGL